MDPTLNAIPSPSADIVNGESSVEHMSSPTCQPYTVPKEFQNQQDTDIILRSSDDFDFHTHKFILSEASQVFLGMFDIPTPSTGIHMDLYDTFSKDGLPFVLMIESHQILENLLRLCYPMDDPVMDSFDEAQETISAMMKYEMDETRGSWMKSTLVSFAKQEPWLVYAFALRLCRISSHSVLQMEECARVAARITLRHELGSGESLLEIEKEDMTRLKRYHAKCAMRLTEMLITGDLIARTRTGSTDWVWLQECGRCRQDRHLMIMIKYQRMGSSGYANEWWMTYYERVKEAIKKQPCGIVVEDDALWMDLVENLSSTCTVCSRRASEEMPDFIRKFSNEIDKAAAEIRLEVVL